MAYIAKSGTDTSPQEASADRNTARKLFKEAQAQGDHSDLVQVMMEKLGDTDSAPAAVSSDDPRAPGGAFAQAELLFNKGDLQGAIALYGQSWAEVFQPSIRLRSTQATRSTSLAITIRPACGSHARLQSTMTLRPRTATGPTA